VAISYPFKLSPQFGIGFTVTMHSGKVFGVATGAYFSQVRLLIGNNICLTILSQGVGAGQTQNIRLPVPGQAVKSCKNMIDLHPLFIIAAGGKSFCCPW
jgi:hypothetical protein